MSHPSYFDKLQRFAGAQPLLGWHIAEDEGGEQETKPTLMFCLGRCENFSSFNNYITRQTKKNTRRRVPGRFSYGFHLWSVLSARVARTQVPSLHFQEAPAGRRRGYHRATPSCSDEEAGQF